MELSSLEEKRKATTIKKTWVVTGYNRNESLRISWWELFKWLPSKRIEILEIVQTRRRLFKIFPTSKDSQFFIVTDSLCFNKKMLDQWNHKVWKTNFNQKYFVNSLFYDAQCSVVDAFIWRKKQTSMTIWTQNLSLCQISPGSRYQPWALSIRHQRLPDY